MSNKEDNEIEYIKEFLKIRGYKSTLDAFESEDRIKSSERKNAKVI